MNHYRDSTDTSMDTFPGVLGEIVFYRTYSRPQGSGGSIKMQTWEENARRNADLLAQLGDLTPAQRDAIYNLQVQLKVTPPGRVLWAGEHSWINREGYTNYLGLFNCVGIQPTSWKWFGYNFLLLMMGCGVGAVIEEDIIDKLPPINKILPQVTITHPPGTHRERLESTTYTYGDNELTIHVGDSKEGWVDSYVRLLEVCSDPRVEGLSHIYIDLGNVRPNGSPIKGFGGTANPVALPLLYEKVMNVLGSAKGRRVTPYEACLLLNWAAVTTVAGNIRRSARWDGYSYGSPSMTGAKDNLWSQNEEGQWVIDPEKDALRMVNISGITHTKPTLGECVSFVRKQYETGEGALYYAPAALVRTNADLLPTKGDKVAFENAYTLLGKSIGRAYLRTKLYEQGVEDVEGDLDHRMMRYGANPCCFAAGTMIVTRVGHYPIESLVGKQGVEVWDGEQWVPTTFLITGVDQPVYEVILSDGSSITATGYHRFILDDGEVLTTLDLMPGDVLMEHTATPEYNTAPYDGSAYLKGFLLGRGISSQGKPKLTLHPSMGVCKDRLADSCRAYNTSTLEPSTEVSWGGGVKGWWMQGLSKTLLPWVTTYHNGLPPECYNWPLEAKCDLIAGYFDAYGTVIGNGQSYQVTSISLQLLLDIQLLLKTMGIRSHVNINDDCGDYLWGIYSLHINQHSPIALSKIVSFSILTEGTSVPHGTDTSRRPCLTTVDTRNRDTHTKEEPVSIVSVESRGIADKVYCCTVPTNNSISLSNGKRTGQCCEILGTNFVCSISQVDLSRYDTSSPTLWDDIYGALDTAALIVCALLKRGFDIPELQSSRQVDPIVAVTLNGVFDFMVNMWGEPWLRWWMAGCPEWWVDSGDNPMDSHTFMEGTKAMLTNMRDRVRGTVTKYCAEHGLKVPNRYTAMQPSGSKSCLTGGTPACYPPKGAYWIRRVTLRRDHPVALAAIAAGYKVVPSTSCRDDNNALIDDAYDPRVTEWLVEIPERCVWADKVQSTYDVAKAPITSQWYLTMACQRYFVTHNTSSTLELNGDEVETLAELIYKEIQDGGDYVSSAIFARDGYTMPRMPYEPITKEQYMAIVQEVESHNNHTPFKELVEYYYNSSLGGEVEVGPTVGCDGDACTIPSVNR